MLSSLVVLALALSGNDAPRKTESIKDSTKCAYVPSQYQDTCKGTIRSGKSFDFNVLVSGPNEFLIEPVGWKIAPTTSEDRQTKALERIADSSERTSTILTVLVAVQVVAVVGALALWFTR